MDGSNAHKRRRFTDSQLNALTQLAEDANWSLLGVSNEERENFCHKWEINKVIGVDCAYACMHLESCCDA